MDDTARGSLIARLAAHTGNATLVIATPDELTDASSTNALEVVSYTPDAAPADSWALTAADYRNAAMLLEVHHCHATILLGEEASSLSDECLQALLDGALAQDIALTLPHYDLGPNEGLVNAAILHPLTTALYGVRVRFPLPLDAAFNAALAARIAAAARGRAGDALLWPVAEAVSAGLKVKEIACGPRSVPVPTQDLTALLSTVVGSLFTDTESKASVWQRSRARLPQTAQPLVAEDPQGPDADLNTEEIHALVSGFSNAYVNLRDLWALVLPPQTQLGLKHLSARSAESFYMPDELWVRIVYDFLLAHRLRTLNQSHLLGALTPIYLAWVASHLRLTANDAARGEQHIAYLAQVFQRDKPYLLARWRWPDRFNP
jgi:hypothetical protein